MTTKQRVSEATPQNDAAERLLVDRIRDTHRLNAKRILNAALAAEFERGCRVGVEAGRRATVERIQASVGGLGNGSDSPGRMTYRKAILSVLAILDAEGER